MENDPITTSHQVVSTATETGSGSSTTNITNNRTEPLSQWSTSCPEEDDWSEAKAFLPTYKIPKDEEGSSKHTLSLKKLIGCTQSLKKLVGWRFGVACCAAGVGAVLLLNIILAIVAATRFGNDMTYGSGTIYTGSCELVYRWSTGLHLVINVLSSLMLAASNYTMQCLSSPTREEIDRAHSHGKHLDLGVPSARNVFGRIAWKRSVFWWLLAVSSVPVHLFYNSVLFTTDAEVFYDVVVAPRKFLTDDDIVYSKDSCTSTGTLPADHQHLRYLQRYFTGGQVQELSVAECIDIYSKSLITDRRAVLLVSSNDNHQWDNISVVDMANTHLAEWAWINGGWSNSACSYYDKWCDSFDSQTYETHANGGHLTLNISQYYHRSLESSYDPSRPNQPGTRYCTNFWITLSIESCITSKPTGFCKLKYTLPLLAAVIGCNLLKLTAILWSLFSPRLPTLVTFGDAVSSFMKVPDTWTSGRCLQGKSNKTEICIHTPQLGNRNAHPKRWCAAVSKLRWILTLFAWSAGLAVLCYLLYAAEAIAWDTVIQSSIFDSGIGKVGDLQSIAVSFTEDWGSAGLVRIILLVNIPQLICSCLYFLLNSVWTSMLQSYEWSGYYHLRKKSLRTSSPEGRQRSTYWLQLPFRYSMPLLLAFAMLYWAISQSIFLVRKTDYDMMGDPETTESLQPSFASFSTLAIFITIMLSTVIVLATIGFGVFRKLKSPMPLAGSSSLAIAAACHPPVDDPDAALLPVSWGDVSDKNSAVGHCCFTSKPVRPIQPGRLYA